MIIELVLPFSCICQLSRSKTFPLHFPYMLLSLCFRDSKDLRALLDSQALKDHLYVVLSILNVFNHCNAVDRSYSTLQLNLEFPPHKKIIYKGEKSQN